MKQFTTTHGSTWTINDKDQLSVDVAPSEGCPMDIETLLPKTQRTYWNPETCDFVSYQRARQLGIDTDREEPEIYMQTK